MGEKVTARDILPQLQKVKRSGRGWTAQCPAHPDKRPSFSIADGDRGVLMHCFAGCSIERIKAALGLNDQPFVPFPRPRPVSVSEPTLDFAGMFEKWNQDTDYYFRDGFAMTLGVDTDALQAVGCAWNGQAWAFPMKNESQHLIGIRLRDSSGKKWAVKGSHQGMFVPTSYPYCVDDATLYIVEGPTDLAAAMTLGLYSIGRPSCLGQEPMIAAFARQKKVRRVVIVSDNDRPGLEGARKLQCTLKTRSCIWITPCKDLREFAIAGGDSSLIESALRDMVWKAA